MTLRQAFLIAALIFALAIVAIDFQWIEPDDPPMAGFLGLSLGCFYAHLLVRR